jgi:glycogen synthase
LYDSHEFATGEFESSATWRLFLQPYVKAIENRYIHQADVVVTVSSTLADQLQALYQLPVLPIVLVNRPWVKPMPFRATGKTVEVLYHGIIAPRRGLDRLIATVNQWPAHFALRIRGPDTGGYRTRLEKLAVEQRQRIFFEDAVSPSRVVPAAATSDIGIFLFERTGDTAAATLPNKIFEYMAGGLMIASADLPEIRQAVEAASSGWLLGDPQAEQFAWRLAALANSSIDQFKLNSLAAMRDMLPERQGLVLKSAIESAKDVFRSRL